MLGQAVTVRLFTANPDLDEGALAKRRASVVSTVALAEVARGIGLGEYVLLGRGEEQTGGRDKDSILADTMEAVIGATYLSPVRMPRPHSCCASIDPLLADPERYGAAIDPKTSLQELASQTGATAARLRRHLHRPRPQQGLHRDGDASATSRPRAPGRARSRPRWPRPCSPGASSARRA